MKIGTFLVDGQAVCGVVLGSDVVLVSALFPGVPLDMVAIAATGLDSEIVRRLDRAPRVPLAGLAWLPPVTNPGKIICVGVNYEDHRLEGKRDKADYPTLFPRYTESLVAHDAPIIRPRQSDRLDFEGEIAAIIGRRAHNVKAADALDYVFGYSCFNDASVRDWQRHTTQWMPGKNFMATGGFGPVIVTSDEAGDPAGMTLTTRLNGEVMQQAVGSDMLFSLPAVIEYVSTFTVLNPGDVIATGTPGGVGNAREPKLFMKPGDVVEIEVSGVGILRNTIADAAAG